MGAMFDNIGLINQMQLRWYVAKMVVDSACVILVLQDTKYS